MKHKWIFIVGLFVALIAAIGTISFSESIPQEETSLYEHIPLFTDALTFIKKYYVREVTAKDLIYGALQGMLGALDPYSEFLPPKKYEDIKTETKGEFGGLGLVVSIKKKTLTVISPMEGTPAERAGMKSGDEIVEIDGVSTKEITFSEAVEKMRGKPGTEVTLSIIRKGEDKILSFTIKRAVIEIENIKDAFILDEHISYVRIVDFGEKTQKMLQQALSQLEADGATALIVDLRNNPGGLLDAAVAVCNMLLKKGDLIVYTKDKSGEEQLRFESSGKQYISFKPLVILINQGSASGSEIVAGAVKDNKRGIIIGEKSFGKASVQTVIPLRDKSAIRLTTAEYYTPSGVSIHGKGIEPDIIVAYRNEIVEELKKAGEEGKKEQEEYLFDKENRKELLLADSQVQRAIAVIKGIAVWDTLEKSNSTK
ncbi:MAG: S41 family peptidase [Candidatus Omnitrophica bacterium]|nr:S41 family peptidase [Candidatus Omnitrophota bacterium]